MLMMPGVEPVAANVPAIPETPAVQPTPVVSPTSTIDPAILSSLLDFHIFEKA